MNSPYSRWWMRCTAATLPYVRVFSSRARDRLIAETRPVTNAYKAAALARSVGVLLGKLTVSKMLVEPKFTGSLAATPKAMPGVI